MSYGRLPSEDEMVAAIEMIERAIRERRVMRVRFFKEKRDRRGYRQWFDDSLDAVFGRRVVLEAAPVVRTVEPLEWTTNAAGEPYMVGICHDAPGEEYPALRTIRIDRIPVTREGLRLRVTRRRFIAEGTALDPRRVSAP